MAPLFTGFRFGFGRSAEDAGPTAFSATGGTIVTPGNGYQYHTFTSPGTFTVSSGSDTVEVLAVGGGGGGGQTHVGGGAGGVIFYGSTPTPVTWGSSLPVLPGSYSISVGSGGNTLAIPQTSPAPAPYLIPSHGGDTTFTHPSGPFTAQGGGSGMYAGPFDSNPYNRGGSGGSGEGAYPGSPNPSPQRQGYPGGTSGHAGGGGAGAIGGNGPTGEVDGMLLVVLVVLEFNFQTLLVL